MLDMMLKSVFTILVLAFFFKVEMNLRKQFGFRMTRVTSLVVVAWSIAYCDGDICILYATRKGSGCSEILLYMYSRAWLYPRWNDQHILFPCSHILISQDQQD